MTYDILIRKKVLKIQERLGMRIGITYGISKFPVAKKLSEVLTSLRELYKIGVKAFVLPPEFFSEIETINDLYKVKYADLLKVKEEAKRFNIELSLRYTELSHDPDKALKLFCNLASIMDCRTFIIHPNFYSKIMPKDQAHKLAIYKINEIITNLRFRTKIGIETTGSISDVGSLEDVIDIVKRTQSTEPILNWAYIHARGVGALRTEEDFKRIIEKTRSLLGSGWLQSVFFLFSGISYGPSGAIKHIPLSRSDLNLEYLIKTIMSFGIKGTLIFEDPEKEKFILKTLDKLANMVR